MLATAPPSARLGWVITGLAMLVLGCPSRPAVAPGADAGTVSARLPAAPRPAERPRPPATPSGEEHVATARGGFARSGVWPSAGPQRGLVLQWRRRLGEQVMVVPEMGVANHADAVVGFDPATGRERWRFDQPKRHLRSKPCHDLPPLTLAHGAVLVGSCDGELVALELLTGAVRWRTRPRPQPEPVRLPVDLSPVVLGGIVVSGALWRDLVFGVDLRTGAVRWTRDQPSLAIEPGAQGERVILRSGEHVTALDGRTGKVAWRIEMETRGITVGRDEVFLCNDLGVFVLDATTGSRRRQLKVKCRGPLLVSEGTLVAHTLGHLSACDLEGHRRWRHRAPNVVGLASHGGWLYYQSWTALGLIRLDTGAPGPGVVLPGSDRRGPLVIAGGRLYVTEGDEVSCYGDSVPRAGRRVPLLP